MKVMVTECYVAGGTFLQYSNPQAARTEALNMLYQYKYQLTPRQSAELLWSRFINDLVSVGYFTMLMHTVQF